MSLPLRGRNAASPNSATDWLFLSHPARDLVLEPVGSDQPIRRLTGTDRCLVELPGQAPSVVPLACPHLGVHLTCGQVDPAGTITCRGHGSSFSRTGAVMAGPASSSITRNEAVATALGHWIWPSDEDPPSKPDADELMGGTVVRSGACIGPFDWRDVGENAVDSAHIHVLHGTPTVPRLTHAEFREREANIGSTITWTTGHGHSREGEVEFRIFKPGLVVVSFGGIVPVVSIVACWRIDSRNTVLSWQVVLPEPLDEVASTRGRGERRVGERLALEVERQLLEDIEIWRHRGPRTTPHYAPTEAAIAQYRAWADA